MSDKTLSDRESAARRAAPTLTTGTPPPAGRRVIRRDPVARGREGGVRAPPSAAKRGGKPWTMTPEELRAAIEALAGGNHTRFARVCGVHDRTVRAWLATSEGGPGAHAPFFLVARSAAGQTVLWPLVRRRGGDGGVLVLPERGAFVGWAALEN